MNFAQKLKRARLAAGLTQVELAEAIGSQQNRISRWESGGGIDVSWLPKLARALGCDVADLVPD